MNEIFAYLNNLKENRFFLIVLKQVYFRQEFFFSKVIYVIAFDQYFRDSDSQCLINGISFQNEYFASDFSRRTCEPRRV